MTKTIQWKVVLSDNNKIVSMESASGLPQEDIESHLVIIGLLENLKQRHLEKLNTLYEKSFKENKDKDNEEFEL